MGWLKSVWEFISNADKLIDFGNRVLDAINVFRKKKKIEVNDAQIDESWEKDDASKLNDTFDP